MAKGLVSDTNLTAIANAIRAKNGSSDTYTPATMATAITNIPTSQVDETTALQYMLNNKTDYTGVAAGLTNLTELPTFTQPDGILEFTQAFRGCSALTSASGIQFTGITGSGSTYRALTVTGMFRGCTNLTTPPTKGEGRYRLTNLSYAFYGCRSLTSLDIGEFNIGGDGSYAFEDCQALTDIAGPNNLKFNGYAQSTNLSRMFFRCYALEKVLFQYSGDSTSFIGSTSNGCKFNSTFYGCTALEKICGSDSPVILALYPTDLSSMFRDCTSLTGIKGLEIYRATNFSGKISMASMFNGCSSLTTMNINTARYTVSPSNINAAFKGCTNLTTFSIPDLSAVTGTGLQNAFQDCPSLSSTSLNNILAALATSAVTSNKTLKYIGLTSTQATTCTGLSNWAALSAAGWTTGY